MFGQNDSNQQANNDNPMAIPSASPMPNTFSMPASTPLAPTDTSAFSSAPITTPATEPPTSSPALSSHNSGDLAKIKQDALQELSPLVGKLDQTPEEKFRTTMMMIQATDDQKLIPAAYEAAKQISDEKAKAQALLDVVNEINYFTQSKS